MRKLLPLVAVWLGLSVLMAGWFLLSSWPAHPRSPLGWTILVVGALPLALLGEYLGDRLIFPNRLDRVGSGFGASTVRITYALVCILALAAILVVALYWIDRMGWLSAL